MIELIELTTYGLAALWFVMQLLLMLRVDWQDRKLKELEVRVAKLERVAVLQQRFNDAVEDGLEKVEARQ